jgi:hypothetical protein
MTASAVAADLLAMTVPSVENLSIIYYPQDTGKTLHYM